MLVFRSGSHEAQRKHTQYDVPTVSYSSPLPNSSLNRLTLLCFFCAHSTLSCDAFLVSSVMNESMRACVSGRFTVNPPSLRPPRTSKPEDAECEDVGDVEGEEEGEIAIFILVVMARRVGIVAVIRMRVRIVRRQVSRCVESV